jgi:hypothetical protein
MQSANEMRAKILLIVILLAGMVLVGGSQTQESKHNNSTANEMNVSNQTAKDKDTSQIIAERINNERVVAFHKWEVTEDDQIEDHYLLCLVREFDSDPEYAGKGVKLSIYDDKKGLIYEEEFSDIDVMSSEDRRRDCPPLLILETNGGGNANFLQILGYQDGKVVELLNEMTRSGYEVRPQFRSGEHSGEPFQVIVRPEGLNSPFEKFAEIYRYKDGEFRLVGKYSQRKVDDYIEKSLSK